MSVSVAPQRTEPAQNRREIVHRARSPLRISFAGGGTDVAPFPQEEGGLVLNATINRYAYGTLRERQDDQIVIESHDLGLAARFAYGHDQDTTDALHLPRAAIGRLRSYEDGVNHGSGFEMFLHSAAPPGSGLGSSSAMMVALVGLLQGFRHLTFSDYEVAQLAHDIERIDLKLAGGMQDHYASAFGGFNFIEFEPDGVVVNPLRVSAQTISELEYSLLLAYTGATRASDHVIKDQTSRHLARSEETVAGLRAQKELALAMKGALLRGRLSELGALLGEAWEQKKRLSPRITTPAIDEIYDEALRAGALGGKITGAGGGGYMLLYCRYDRRHRVAEAVERAGARVSSIAFEHSGLTHWTTTVE
jgi:D-glycero-alpha-D-manno-heptose-7-phosphate kinase